MHGLERALHVGLEHEVERRGLAALELLEEVLEARAARGDDRLVPGEPHALGPRVRERAGVAEVARDAHLVAGLRRLGESEDLHGRRRPDDLDRLAEVVHERLDLAPRRAGDDRVADLQAPLLDEHRRDGAAADLEVRLEHGPGRPADRPRGQLLELGDDRDLLEQVVDAGPLQGRDLDDHGVPAPLLRARAPAGRAARARGRGSRRGGPSC